MKWRGETDHQWKMRTIEWHRHFCLFPRQMRGGNWVWLERVWCRRVMSGVNGNYWWEFSDSLTAPEDVRPTSPPPKPRG